MKKDNIEDLYRKLKGFEKQPPENLWPTIEAGLQQKKKRGGLLFWIGSAAAVFLFLLGYIFYNTSKFNTKTNKTFTTTRPAQDKDSVDSKTALPYNIINQKNSCIVEEQNSSEKNNLTSPKEITESTVKTSHISKSSKSSIANNTAKPTKSKTMNNTPLSNKITTINTPANYDKQNSEHKNTFKNGVNQTPKDASTEKREGLANIITQKDTLTKAIENALKDIALKDDEKSLTQQKKPKKPSWLIEISGGISNTASESAIQNTSVQTSAQNDLVYGLKLGYALSERLTLKTGVANNVLGQKISNIGYANSENALNADISQNIISNENILLLVSDESQDIFNNDFSVVSGVEISQGSFRQQFNYLQIPLEFSYALFHREKFNIGLGFGGTINFLTDNKAYINDENIGENLNVNSTLFGASILNNFNYVLYKNMNVFIEPSINFFQKPVDNKNQSFSNTQFRLLFGFRYKLN